MYLVKKKISGQFYAMKVLKKDMIMREGQEENTKSKLTYPVLLVFS